MGNKNNEWIRKKEVIKLIENQKKNLRKIGNSQTAELLSKLISSMLHQMDLLENKISEKDDKTNQKEVKDGN